MKLRCKLADMALVVKGRNAGKIVEVVQGYWLLNPGDLLTVTHNSKKYEVRIVLGEGPFWFCSSKMALLDVQGTLHQYGVFLDEWLLPLRPERDPDSVPRLVETPNETRG